MEPHCDGRVDEPQRLGHVEQQPGKGIRGVAAVGLQAAERERRHAPPRGVALGKDLDPKALEQLPRPPRIAGLEARQEVLIWPPEREGRAAALDVCGHVHEPHGLERLVQALGGVARHLAAHPRDLRQLRATRRVGLIGGQAFGLGSVALRICHRRVEHDEHGFEEAPRALLALPQPGQPLLGAAADAAQTGPQHLVEVGHQVAELRHRRAPLAQQPHARRAREGLLADDQLAVADDGRRLAQQLRHGPRPLRHRWRARLVEHHLVDGSGQLGPPLAPCHGECSFAQHGHARRASLAGASRFHRHASATSVQPPVRPSTTRRFYALPGTRVKHRHGRGCGPDL